MDSGWPSAAVALGLIGLIGAICIAAIIKYDNIDDALKFWSALAGLLGVITGAAATYFFTRTSVNAAQTAAQSASQAAEAAGAQAEATNRAVDAMTTQP
jgi:hypothetical protein